ncbi:hypothetical protein HCAG_06824 [Histoplasma mississippiense (nom. inval.)]|uniref:hypothetical protein n=1 Tax=Ajellomyces capsulatus (strain NAm1 / WU24) TaxID=2059318 RepID=UPI000157C942|nr:hypothetical protein HCAG_06824 [Histoplasma mississippiense (nom. inval.)]EDN09657.1 hypothetical protein HCAG_06824 [Histoplasma mississippiense (nom. inval.)]
MREKYESEKQRSKDIQDAKIKLDLLKVKRDEATRSGDTQTASDLIYYAIPDVEKRIEQLEAERARVDAELSIQPGGGGETLLADAVGPEQINEIVARWTGIPVTKLRTTEKDRLLQMESHLSKIVVGQKEAVQSVSNAIRLQRSGLSNPNSPPSFLFCGPSGTDGQGRIVDAKNCIVVMTSNLGAEFLQRSTIANGQIDSTTKELVMGTLRNYFLPEFLNRISSIVIFNTLTRREIRKIVDLRLEEIQQRLEQNDRSVTIECTDEAKDYLGNAGYSPLYGARPLSRLIEKEVLNRLAVLILKGAIKDGETARVVMEYGRITVLPNHGTESEDEEMVGDDALEEMEEDLGEDDLYE